MGYRILGFAVWNGAKWYLRRRYGGSKKYLAAGVVGVAVVGLAVAGAKRGTD
ncbi:hypothetical protein [Baekduia soli]|uniref:hypothetical protein n=1 Tax=Baekduia soli TaxID=496014 RepID=UPI001652383F|nr:hypothetical protein [Baekduia soli]